MGSDEKLLLDFMEWAKTSMYELDKIIQTEKLGNECMMEIQEVYASGFLQEMLIQILGRVF